MGRYLGVMCHCGAQRRGEPSCRGSWVVQTRAIETLVGTLFDALQAWRDEYKSGTTHGMLEIRGGGGGGADSLQKRSPEGDFPTLRAHAGRTIEPEGNCLSIWHGKGRDHVHRSSSCIKTEHCRVIVQFSWMFWCHSRPLRFWHEGRDGSTGKSALRADFSCPPAVWS